MEKEIVETSEFNNEEVEEFVFPSKHYMPKELTQQAEFLQKYPTYDGRGIKIAILDTGVDPSCPGLQKTTDGKIKLIECLDLTGAGDVDTSTVKKSDENGILIGLTERELKIPKTWKNPSGDWHVGTKPLHELYSYKIKKRINEAKCDEFNKKNKSSIAEAMKELNEHEKKVGAKSKKISDKEDREEINAKLELLKEAEKLKVESPVVDCIVWFDGEKWKACLDTSLTGDLENAKVMSNFNENQEYGFLSSNCLMSYCLNIHDNGNLLEICATHCDHGTHVAHIAAGHFPDDPEKDGLAPGAQIISLCIGDSRGYYGLNAQAFIRALNKCIELKVDVINFSYSTVRNCVDNGSFAKLIKNVVEKHGIIFVSSAGNYGPALSTMGFAYGKLHHSGIYVGAYLTAEMKETMYSHFETDNSVVFPFSSRGPCLDGTLGVSISAPGAAIAGVPKHNLKNSEVMAGTSMSAPNATGNIACLLSAMKSESIPISPFRIKLGLMNSAMMPEDGSHHPFSLGAGIIQISSAFELIKSSMASIPSNLTEFKIQVNDKRGIYFRELYDVNRIHECNAFVKAKFNCDKELEKVVNYECSVLLKLSEGSENFVKCPKYSRLPSSSFSVHVDPTKLEPGKVHYAEVVGIDPKNPSLGPLFRLPITVIIPEKLAQDDEYEYKKKLTLEPANPQRIFLQTPKGSTYVKVIFKSYEEQKTTKFMLQSSSPVFDYRRCFSRWCIIPPKDSEMYYFHVLENQTTEYCITQFWSNLDSSKIKVTFEFYGFSMKCNGDELTMFSTNPTNNLYFTNNLRKAFIQPTIEFTDFCQPLDPKESVITPLKERDIIEGNESFGLVLTYNFKVNKEEDYSFKLDNHGYYSQFIDYFLLQLSTSSKKHLCTSGYGIMKKLEKGDYVIRVYIRHSDPEILEKLKSLQLLAIQTFKTAINGYLYKDAGSALKGTGQRYWGKQLQSGESDWAYLESISNAYHPISYTAGSYFKGSVFLQPSLGSYFKYFSSFDIKYMVTAPKSTAKKESKVELEALTESEVSKVVTDVTEPNAMKDAIRDIEISYITKETNAEKASALFEKLSTEYPAHIPIYSAEIERLSKLKDYSKLKTMVEKLLQISESNKVAEYFGVKSEFSEENLRKKEIMTKKKAAIMNALFLQANLALDEFLKDILKECGISFEKNPEVEKKIEKSTESKESNEKAEVEKEASEVKAEDKSIENKESNEKAVEDEKVEKEASEVKTEDKSTDSKESNDKTADNEKVEKEASKSKTSEDENKSELKSKESKESSDKSVDENEEKDADKNVKAAEEIEIQTKATDDVEIENETEKTSNNAGSGEENETKNDAIDDISSENLNETQNESANAEVKEPVENKKEDNQQNDESEEAKNEDESNSAISELEVVIENDKDELVDKENIPPSSDLKPANSPGNESRNSVSSDDSFERISDSGVESDEKSDASNPKQDESKCNESGSTASENSASSEKSEDTIEIDEKQLLLASNDQSAEKLETNDELKTESKEEIPEQPSETAEIHKISPDEIKIETEKELEPPVESHEKPEAESSPPNEESKKEDSVKEVEKPEIESSPLNDGSKTEDPVKEVEKPKIESSPQNEESKTEAPVKEVEKSEPIPKIEINLEEIEKVYRAYMLFADSTSENAKIIQAKYAVANGRFATALSELKKIIADKTTNSDYLYVEKAIIQLLKKLGWNHLAEEAQKTLLIKHQKFYRLF